MSATKTFRILLLLPILAALGGCARPADLSKLKHFHDAGIAFDYPGNWKVTSNEPTDAGRLIFLEEPGDALVALTVYGPGVDVDLEVYSDAFTKGLGDAVPFNLIKPTGSSTTADRIDCKYTIQLVGVSVPHTANITRHVMGAQRVICLTQVSDEDRPLVAAGFDLIRRTLVADPAEKPGGEPPAKQPGG